LEIAVVLVTRARSKANDEPQTVSTEHSKLFEEHLQNGLEYSIYC